MLIKTRTSCPLIRACHLLRQVTGTALLLTVLVVSPACLLAQCSSTQADAAFHTGMEFAHHHEWAQAHDSLLAGEHLCRKQKRFPIELAGVAFEQKNYPEAARWIRRGLKLDPHDKYANNFAGTVYFLMGNLPAALKYWNRIDKPQIHALNLDQTLRIRPLILGRAFTFSPAALLTEKQYETTRARLNGLGIFSAYRIQLTALPSGSFDANFHAVERDGFGDNRWDGLLATFRGLPYETIYPSYYNLGHSAINVDSLLRWDSQKRRVWISFSSPLHDLPQRRWAVSFDARNENWAIRRSFAGPAPILGSLNLQKQAATLSLTDYVTGRLRWSAGAELSHRSYRNVMYGTALTPDIVLPGMELKYLVSITGKPVDIPQRRLTVTTSLHSQTARIWSNPSRTFEKLQGDALLRWFPSQDSNRWEVKQQVRGGGLLGATPFDELFMLGVERDNSLWLRGDKGDRDGRKGSAPLGTRYFLANSDIYRRLYSNGLVNLQVGPLFDVGKIGAPTTGLATGQWLFDAGISARITVLGTRVILTWGHDLNTGNNALFGTAQ